jgi:hypothetical protein
VILLHGSLSRDLIMWLPVFLSASLLVAVNIAPTVSRALEAIKSSPPVLVVRHQTQGLDLESQPLMQDPNGNSQESQFMPVDYCTEPHARRNNARSNGSTIDLDAVSTVSTSSQLRRLVFLAEGRSSDMETNTTIPETPSADAICSCQRDLPQICQQQSLQTGSLEVQPTPSIGHVP